MDLLFTRYANPFILIDNFILTNSLNNFVDDFLTFRKEELQEKSNWEFFLHKVYEQSWSEFCKSIEMPKNDESVDLGATLMKSKNMLMNFTPEGV